MATMKVDKAEKENINSKFEAAGGLGSPFVAVEGKERGTKEQ